MLLSSSANFLRHLRIPGGRISALNRGRERITFFPLDFPPQNSVSHLSIFGRMKNKPNLDLYPFNKKVFLDLLCEKTFQDRKSERRREISAQELKVESLNLSPHKSRMERFVSDAIEETFSLFRFLETNLSSLPKEISD